MQRPKLKNLPLLCQYATSAWKASHQYRPRTLIPRTTTEIEEKNQKSILKGWVGWVNFLAMIFYKYKHPKFSPTSFNESLNVSKNKASLEPFPQIRLRTLNIACAHGIVGREPD